MTARPLKVLTALPLIGHPRDSKRISMLQRLGFAVEAVAFHRDYHEGRLPSCPVEILGSVSHGRYVARLVTILRSLRRMRARIRKADVIYASGIDMAFLALLSGMGIGRPTVVEIGDVRELQVAPGPVGWVVRSIERFLVNSCRLLVVTAPDFADLYYRKRLQTKTPAIVIENKLEPEAMRDLPAEPILSGKPLQDRPLRIGYFGLLRCEWTWQVLTALAARSGTRYEIVAAGLVISPKDLVRQAERHSNIFYLGTYKSPDELPRLYNQVDLVWACYPPMAANDWNFRWARTNRFYEACHFKRALVVREGSNDAKDVRRYGIGMTLDATNVDEAVSAFESLTLAELEGWTSSMAKLPVSAYQYTTEPLLLKNALDALVLDGPHS
jgi:succinoglycan biosynthesis protein ExoL